MQCANVDMRNKTDYSSKIENELFCCIAVVNTYDVRMILPLIL